MRALEECSGPWLGAWIQFGLRGHMRLRLTFSGGRLMGGGADRIGPFDVIGTYDADDTVAFIKSYPTHRIRYRGKWDGSMIFGTWQIIGGAWASEGPFEIWPENESIQIEELFEEHESTQARGLVNA